jgi:hypothetical protein
MLKIKIFCDLMACSLVYRDNKVSKGLIVFVFRIQQSTKSQFLIFFPAVLFQLSLRSIYLILSYFHWMP